MSKPSVIAVLDDDEAMRAALCDLLEVMGIATRGFADARAFLAAYAPLAFAGLITDVEMPRMSGLELLRRLRLQDPALPVIVISAATDAPTRALAMEAGASAYLTKPVDHDVLLRHVATLLAGP